MAAESVGMGCSLCPGSGGHRLSALEQVIEENSESVDRHPMSAEWMQGWSADVCAFQGFEPGTEEYEQCRAEQVEKVLASPARSQAIRSAQVAMSVIERGRL